MNTDAFPIDDKAMNMHTYDVQLMQAKHKSSVYCAMQGK